jgi:hypothetical protein
VPARPIAHHAQNDSRRRPPPWLLPCRPEEWVLSPCTGHPLCVALLRFRPPPLVILRHSPRQSAARCRARRAACLVLADLKNRCPAPVQAPPPRGRLISVRWRRRRHPGQLLWCSSLALWGRSSLLPLACIRSVPLDVALLRFIKYLIQLMYANILWWIWYLISVEWLFSV